MAPRDVVTQPAGRTGLPPASDMAAEGIESEAELAMSYCPRCSARLAARSCKLMCPSCGYYMSCSYFY